MKYIIITFLLSVVLIGCGKKTPQTSTDRVDATQLEKDIWANFGDVSYLEKHINDAFQSSHSDGSRNKTDEIKLIQSLNVKKHQFSDFKATQNDNVAIVTYNISVTVTVNGQEISTLPSQRLSTWQKTDKGWQWIAHATLDPQIK